MVDLWRRLDYGDRVVSLSSDPRSAFVKLAMRVLSIVPNSAGVERFFSKLGVVHSKLRNRLKPEKAQKSVLIKADIGQMYGSGRRVQKRKFDHEDSSDAEEDDNRNAEPVSADTGTQREEDVLAVDPDSFTAVVQDIIEDGDDSDEDDTPFATGTSSTSARPPNTTTAPLPTAGPIPSRATGLSLRFLFSYPPPGSSTPLASYWGQAEANLERERQVHEGLSQ